jgi:hypothetical protein
VELLILLFVSDGDWMNLNLDLLFFSLNLYVNNEVIVICRFCGMVDVIVLDVMMVYR